MPLDNENGQESEESRSQAVMAVGGGVVWGIHRVFPKNPPGAADVYFQQGRESIILVMAESGLDPAAVPPTTPPLVYQVAKGRPWSEIRLPNYPIRNSAPRELLAF